MTECSASVLSPRESGRFIAQTAKHVKINEEEIERRAAELAELVAKGSLSASAFTQTEVHPAIANEEAINWIFLVDGLNFCFWSPSGDHWTVTWRGKTYSGYFALCAAVNRALDEGQAVTDPKFYSRITLRDLKRILRGDNDLVSIPLLNQRLDCLHELGLTLLERFDGKFLNCLLSCDGSAEKLLATIVENFPCYRDEAVYNGRKVSFYKRAQILIGDIWACFKGRNEGHFKDIDKLTMFPDYRVPQVLAHFKILVYSEPLLEKLSKGILLEHGSEEEVEIRGSSIRAVDLLNAAVCRRLLTRAANALDSERNLISCNPILIDHYLWDYRRQHASELEATPFHKTLCIYY